MRTPVPVFEASVVWIFAVSGICRLPTFRDRLLYRETSEPTFGLLRGRLGRLRRGTARVLIAPAFLTDREHRRGRRPTDRTERPPFAPPALARAGCIVHG